MLKNFKDTPVAYFSMEIALESDLKTYAGGLGVLAGDLLRAAASLKFPIVGISLLNPQGYLKQRIGIFNNQIAKPESDFNFLKLKKLKETAEIYIGTEKVKIGAWQYLMKNKNGFTVPVYFLDTNLETNSKEAKKISGRLYTDNRVHRLKQEIVLGRGGIKILQALGYKNISKIHLNEGHGSLAAVELFLESTQKNIDSRVKDVRGHCVFTTHTSIPNSQEVFLVPDFLKYQLDFPTELLKIKEIVSGYKINFTGLGFYFSSYINAVSKKHQEIVSRLYPNFKIENNTNGVDSTFWATKEFKQLYDKYIPGWYQNNSLLSEVFRIPKIEIVSAHQKNKKKLIEYINKLSRVKLKEDIFTIGFARRFTAYKRPEFLLANLNNLLKIDKEIGRLQIIYAGKAHPGDLNGQKIINRVLDSKNKLRGKIDIIFLEDYDIDKAKLLVSGVDLWLNTPQPYNEASGTSGMKAAHNGIPQFSTLDGWWLEGYKKDKTGWAILENKENNLYSLLTKIISLYYYKKEDWSEIMRSTISLNASYFNSQRNLKQYIREAYKMKI